MAISVPNTLESATSDFPLTYTDQIAIPEGDKVSFLSLSNYLASVYAVLTTAITTHDTNIDGDLASALTQLLSAIGSNVSDGGVTGKSLRQLIIDKLGIDETSASGSLQTQISNILTQISSVQTNLGTSSTTTNTTINTIDGKLGHLSNSDTLYDRLNELSIKLGLASLNDSDTLAYRLSTLLQTINSNNSTLSQTLGDLSASNTLSSKLLNLQNTLSDDTNPYSMISKLNSIIDLIEGLDEELTGAKGRDNNDDNNSYIYAITDAVRSEIQNQITKLDRELTGADTDETIGKIAAAKEALNGTLVEVKALIGQLDDQLTGSDNTNGQLVAITNAVTQALNAQVNDIKYTIKNTTDRINLTVLSIGGYKCVIKCDADIDSSNEESPESLEVKSYKTVFSGGIPTILEGTPSVKNDNEYEADISQYVPTKITFNIKKSGNTVYSKSIEVMRKVPIYIGHSDNGNLETFDTGVFNKNYLTDSLYGECEIPANSWSGDAYLYIAIPKEFFRQKTVQISGGTGTENINLQLLQNGFPVGKIHEKTISGYYVYRSSQMISEHSNLELK